MSEQITEEELEAWEEILDGPDTKHFKVPWQDKVLRLIAEVRSQREDVEHAEAIAMGAERRAEGLQAKIEEQRKAIERLQMGIFREETGSENMVGKDQGT